MFRENSSNYGLDHVAGLRDTLHEKTPFLVELLTYTLTLLS